MDEFDLIAKYFKPLSAAHPSSLGLSDDAAILTIPPGQELVVTKDALSEGVHFIGDEDAPLIAQKALRVNLSDLAGMGATPLVYFLGLMLPKSANEGWVERFAAGLEQDQRQFAITLAGGDTIATRGPLSLSVTALGLVPTGQALKRSGAKAGDKIFVSGTLGDAALGLLAAQRKLDSRLSREDRDTLERRYQLPEPRLGLGKELRGLARAAMDISDGLVQDLGHICAASQCAAVIHVEKLPLSKAAWHTIELTPELGSLVLIGGDDYELLFTVPPDLAPHVPKNCTEIGVMQSGSGITVLGPGGQPIELDRRGFKHF